MNAKTARGARPRRPTPLDAKPRDADGPLPEGPYETGSAESDRTLARDPFRFVDLVLAIQDARKSILGLSPGERELRMILQLVRHHDLGRIVTTTSLAASSGLTYGTAMRTLEDLLKRGLRRQTGQDRHRSLVLPASFPGPAGALAGVLPTGRGSHAAELHRPGAEPTGGRGHAPRKPIRGSCRLFRSWTPSCLWGGRFACWFTPTRPSWP